MVLLPRRREYAVGPRVRTAVPAAAVTVVQGRRREGSGGVGREQQGIGRNPGGELGHAASPQVFIAKLLLAPVQLHEPLVVVDRHTLHLGLQVRSDNMLLLLADADGRQGRGHCKMQVWP